MTEQTPNPESTATPPPTPPPLPPVQGDWREQRRAERMARRDARWQRRGSRPYGWFGGVILLLLGLYFLLQNLGVQVFTNWWAIFILIPAFWSFVAAWNIYQEHGKLTRGSVSTLVVGILLTALAAIFLLNLAIGLFWPILLILGGLALLVSALYPR